LDEILGAVSSAVFNSRKLKFWLKAPLEPTFEIHFENFQKMLDGSKFGQRCLLHEHALLD
jgi:hypothetical protein